MGFSPRILSSLNYPVAMCALLMVIVANASNTIVVYGSRRDSSPSHGRISVRLRREDAYFILAVALCNRSATAHQRSCLGMVHSLHTRAFPGILSGVW